MFRPVVEPIAGHLGWSALLAALPVLTLFILLAWLRTRAWVASLAGLAVALLVAVLAYSMPVGQALLAASQGAAFGVFPLVWTFAAAIWIYTMTVQTGYFDVLRRAFTRVSDDRRIQALVIAFCFGSLLEALAGQGTPVAITTVMLVAVGFAPMRAVVVALVANTVPAAFGPLGLPITTLAKVSDLPVGDLGEMAGRQVPLLALFVPLLLVFIVDGRRGLRETWLPAIACGSVFGLTQFVTSNYISMPLADVLAALAGACAVGMAARMRSTVVQRQTVLVTVGGASDALVAPGTPDTESEPPAEPRDPPAEVWRAYGPYLAIIAIFAFSQIHPVTVWLDSVTRTFHWPGLHLLTVSGKPSTLPLYKFNWLGATGTLLLAAGLVTMVVLRVRPRAAAAAYVRTLGQLRWAILTVTGMLAMSFVMNASAQTATLGNWMAGAGQAFAVLSPVLGWLGVAVTGSDTSSNSLFGALQVTAAHKTGLSPTLLAAANASGGVAGKMISLQNLTIGASAVGLAGREGDLIRRVFGWSVLLVAGMCLIVGLQATPVLSWMVPR
jgi:lactate permease